jgi:hypothetical protein
MYVNTHFMLLQVLCAWLPLLVICPNTVWTNLDRRNESDILLTSGTTGSHPNIGLTPPACLLHAGPNLLGCSVMEMINKWLTAP